MDAVYRNCTCNYSNQVLPYIHAVEAFRIFCDSAWDIGTTLPSRKKNQSMLCHEITMKQIFLAFSMVYNTLNKPFCNLRIYSTTYEREYLRQKCAAFTEMNINHHTLEWFLNKPNGWVILFGNIITDLRLPVLYVPSRQMNENYCQTKKHPTAETSAKICSWNRTLHAQPSIIESVISPFWCYQASVLHSYG